jgi:hypothetical protein
MGGTPRTDDLRGRFLGGCSLGVDSFLGSGWKGSRPPGPPAQEDTRRRHRFGYPVLLLDSGGPIVPMTGFE